MTGLKGSVSSILTRLSERYISENAVVECPVFALPALQGYRAEFSGSHRDFYRQHHYAVWFKAAV